MKHERFDNAHLWAGDEAAADASDARAARQSRLLDYATILVVVFLGLVAWVQ